MCLLALLHFHIIKMGVRTSCSLSCLVGGETSKTYLLKFFKWLSIYLFGIYLFIYEKIFPPSIEIIGKHISLPPQMA